MSDTTNTLAERLVKATAEAMTTSRDYKRVGVRAADFMPESRAAVAAVLRELSESDHTPMYAYQMERLADEVESQS